MNKPDQLVIVHGFLSTPRHHWFHWLKSQIEKKSIEVILPRMPFPRAPKPDQWLSHLKASVPLPSRNTWFIAHSLGCVTLLQYLASQNVTVGGIVLVAGFADPVPGLPELNQFTQAGIDFQQVKACTHHRIILQSLNDDVVPNYLTETLSSSLSAELYSFPAAGHFRALDGFNQFPALMAVLKDYF